MKDNFQGPTQYNITNPGGQAGPGGHQTQYSAPSPWHSQPTKAPFSKPSAASYEKLYDDRKYVHPDARDPKAQAMRSEPQDRNYKEYEKRRGFSPRRSPVGRRVSPEPGRRVSPSGRRVSPPARRGFSPGRRVSPSGRRVSPSGRRVSPSGRRVSPPGRRVSPPGRRISPHARKFSPPVKRLSPERRMPAHHPIQHLPGRRDSPHKRSSPVRRLVSPPRRVSPGRRDDPQRMARYSPERLHPDKPNKYGQDKLKQIRPAYEPTPHASNQTMYSGGYRPDNRENVQYSMQGMRQAEPRISPWQRERDETAGSMKKQDDDRRDMGRMQMRDRLPDAVSEAKRALSPQRKSRSPIRRDRSPIRDRYKRRSPSPRSSHSPRRSWALEKRRSPEIRDAPPPPTWPGQTVRDTDYPRTSRPNFPERDHTDKTKHVPVWEPRTTFEKIEDTRVIRSDNNERRPFIEDKIRPVKEIPAREPVPLPLHNERFIERDVPKFSSCEDYEAERREKYRRRETSIERKPLPQREEYDPRRPHPDEYHPRREPSPRHDSRKEELVHSTIDKDFDDIYKRALQFKKKAEELRRLSKRNEYLEEEGSRSRYSEREREDRTQRYDERHRFREEDLRERADRPHDERARDDRPRDDGPRRDDYRRDDYVKEEHHIYDRYKRFTVSPSIRVKRDKAIEEICNKILDRHENYRQLKGEQRQRVFEELKLAVARIVFDMFGDKDVSFIEIIVKYQAKYNEKDEENILQEVTSSLPSQFRIIKRQAPELSEVPAKIRRSQSPPVKTEYPPRPKLSDSKKKRAPSPKKQRPQKSLKRRTDPPKLESKPIPKDTKVIKGPTKSSEVPQTTPGASRKPETKKQEEEKMSVPLPASVETPLQGGHYELNARMTRMVEAELRDIMIKVWQELPDEPSDDAEALVVENLRNQAGDDFRNVLGLNITKRLLNVHNPLCVKVQFSGKPEKVHLGEFLKKYNFTAFKRIEKTMNMFAARVKTINDFDRICSAKDVRCGDIKVTVAPIYKFTKCPPNLITSFYEEKDSSDEITETKEKEEKIEEKTEIISPKKVVAKTENDPAKPKVDSSKTENIKEVPKLVSKPVENKTVSKSAIENKPAAVKPISKPAVENKDTVKKLAVDNETAINKTPVKPPVEKPAVNKPTAKKPVSKPVVVQNKAVIKPSVNNKPTAATKPAVANKPAAEIKIVAKTLAENEKFKKPLGTPKKNDTGKKPNPSPVKTPIKFDGKPNNTKKVADDYDELDDHDILALMSEGIVLDECSGSDDE